MSFTLRPYQSEAVDRGVAFLARTEPGYGGLLVEPQGSGKSLIVAGLAASLPGRCLIFQPSKEVLEQNASKLQAYGYSPCVYSASVGLREVGSITLATIGSVKGVTGLFKDVPYVIIDECHLTNAKGGMYDDFLGAMSNTRVLGLTATPYRLTKDGYGGSMLKFLTRTRPRLFSEVVHYTQIGDLMQQGFLVPPTYQHVSGFTTKELSVNTTGGDWTDESIKRYYNKSGFHDRLRRVVERALAAGRKNVLVFTRFVEEAEALAQQVPGTAVVSADTKASMRTAIVQAFRAGEIQTVANVNCLSTGFDYPELDTVVLARPTMSLALYMQQVGRVMRPAPTKRDAWVIDMVDQVAQFGKVEDIRLKPGGKSGAKWAVYNGQGRELTNVYLGDKRRR